MNRFQFAYKMLTNKCNITYRDDQPFYKRNKYYIIYKILKDDYGFRKRDDQVTTEKYQSIKPVTSVGNFDLSLLNDYKNRQESKSRINNHIQIINGVLQSQQLNASVQDVIIAPSTITYELYVNDTDLNKVLKLNNVLSMRLQSPSVNISILHKNGTVGVILEREHREKIGLKKLLMSNDYLNSKGELKFPLGRDLTNNPIIADLRKLKSLLVAGESGGGKSVFLNNFIISQIYNKTPEELKFILIDCKKLEFTPYKNIPHLLKPVVTDPKEATETLYWAVDEMEKRYTLMSQVRSRDIESYNKKANDKLPYLVIVIDEFSNLIKYDKGIEMPVEMLAEKARAAGIHLVIATQNPISSVITSNIKANLQTSIAFKVKDHNKSQTILGTTGAEKLLEEGDMILDGKGFNMFRMQGTFINEREIDNVLNELSDDIPKHEMPTERGPFSFLLDEQYKEEKTNINLDSLFYDVGRFFIKQGKGSKTSIRKHFKTSRGTNVGGPRAEKILNQLVEMGVISEKYDESTKGHSILMTMEDFENL